ncbi:3-hydroxyacyl-CoA dehydrogenase [Rhizocola hellebori]|uniref:3-hydroxyacyl-CoA dehydrogenase n=1 Tax=Rhizocola hellebori TaxID=1392758 RepID=A0A8J3Q3F3_9ACTN|nr:3-hydroxyacyl-CoA dehydrogenase NAD-binding domain-containing protein [Rhizocola hellebori]GIH03029.1 3-hydroxyacyl-CoA dehydrogenase [Rhizocola hellebori]
MTEQNMIGWDRDADGIVTLTMDDPTRGANTMNLIYTQSMASTLERLAAERDSITGVILTSAKKTFFAGGDLDMLRLATPETAAEVFGHVEAAKGQLRRLETLGIPVVAAINGSALGGGLEIALACHRRIVADDARIELGFPEVTLGLLPGGGGIVRTVRMLGLATALTELLLKGQRLRPAAAAQLGLVHEVIAPDQLLQAARAWIRSGPEAAQPWAAKGWRIPGGSATTPSLAAMLPSFPAHLRKELKGAPYPAPRAILAAAVESTQVDVDTALTLESRYLVNLMIGPVAKNMIKAFFFDMQEVNNRPRPASHTPRKPARVGVLGAGMMGAAIAYVCAKAGLAVVLKDVTVESAEKGKDYSRRLVEKAVARGRSTAEAGAALLERITATAAAGDLAGVEIVIEAVFEDPAIKHQVFSEIEDVVAVDALLASNTSTLPISLLAEGVKRREDFIGLHFFSPVDKMPLVEIIKGRHTSEESVARALDLVALIRKTPIVVNDSRGFFTSRVIGTFTNEGISMLGEGLNPSSIEQASAQAGYPAPVLSLMDELTLTLPRKIRQETAEAVRAAGGTWLAHPADLVIDRMIDEFGRRGRSTGAGFYDYDDTGKRAGLWPGLSEHFGNGTEIPFEDMKERMLFAEALESIKCLEEGVLTSVADANVGSILGIGFPAWTGGVLQYVNQYPGGLPGFVKRAAELQERYGVRFAAPQLLLDKAASGDEFR